MRTYEVAAGIAIVAAFFLGCMWGQRIESGRRLDPSNYPSLSCARQILQCERLGGFPDISLGDPRQFECHRTGNIEVSGK